MMIMFALLALASVIELLASIIFAWMAAAVELAAQVTIRMIWQALVRKIASITGAQVAKAAGTAVIDMAQFAAMGAGLMVVVDGVTQGAQMAKGLRDKDDFDAESLGKSAIGGAIGGGAAGLTHSVARVAVMGARDAAKQFGKEVPGWLVGVGQGGYAVAQIAAVAWSNPIVNIAVDSPDAFWGGILGALGSFGGSAKPGGSGVGGGATKVKSVDLSFPGGDADAPPADRGESGSSPGEKPPGVPEVPRTSSEMPPAYAEKPSVAERTAGRGL
ncbi:hypothetical protein ACFOSH_44380, partial [Amycolatopsis speibonae]